MTSSKADETEILKAAAVATESDGTALSADKTLVEPMNEVIKIRRFFKQKWYAIQGTDSPEVSR